MPRPDNRVVWTVELRDEVVPENLRTAVGGTPQEALGFLVVKIGDKARCLDNTVEWLRAEMDYLSGEPRPPVGQIERIVRKHAWSLQYDHAKELREAAK